MLKHIRKIGWFTWIVLLIAVLVLAACGGDDDDDKADNGNGGDSTTTTDTGAPAIPDPIPEVAANADWTPIVQEFEGVPMVLVPLGCFMMGEDLGELSEMDERPVHEQCIETAFWLDQTEVTRASYAECVAAGACSEVPESKYAVRDLQPVNQVTWYQAREYCAWRGGRLPTEVEWEFAARGPDNLRHPWGDTFDFDLTVVSGNAKEPADVGSIPGGVSWVGALDIAGNVWEWTSTVWKLYPYDPTDGREDPESDRQRVWRGGSFLLDDDVRTANRDVSPPDRVNEEVGIRCVRDVE